MLGGKQPQVEHALAKTNGMDMDAIAQILKIAAPIAMGLLSKEKQSANADANGIGNLLGSVLGQGGSVAAKEPFFLESILDANNDGSIIDGVSRMVMGGGTQEKGGLGGLLSGLFSRRQFPN